MTEDSTKDDEYLVRVQAQVMTRDDSSGGWVPMGGGGLSDVGLVRRSIYSADDSSLCSYEYLIYGHRIADKSVVLKCCVNKDIRYTRANPKFHHWHTDDKRFGLTFERSDDAKKFDHSIKKAVADLTDGHDVTKSEGDEDVFGEVDLSISRTGSSSQSTNSTTTSSPQSPGSFVSGVPEGLYSSQNSHLHHLYRVHYLNSSIRGHKHTSPHSSDKSSSKSDSIETSSIGHEEIWVKPDEPTSISGKSDQALLDTDNVELKEYSYVIFARNHPHEYSYPNLETTQKPPTKREVTSNVKRHNHQILTQPKPPLPVKKKKDQRKSNLQTGPLITKARCKHCNDNFSPEENHRGSCEEAPDNMEKCIEIVTCVWCMKGPIYHCMSDSDGQYGHPCICDSSDESNCKKWTALSILSFFFPCLWCYWPLKTCHMCGTSCGCCGGRHKAS